MHAPYHHTVSACGRGLQKQHFHPSVQPLSIASYRISVPTTFSNSWHMHSRQFPKSSSLCRFLFDIEILEIRILDLKIAKGYPRHYQESPNPTHGRRLRNLKLQRMCPVKIEKLPFWITNNKSCTLSDFNSAD